MYSLECYQCGEVVVFEHLTELRNISIADGEYLCEVCEKQKQED